MARLIFFILLTLTLYAQDMTLEIVKDVGNRPKIIVEDHSSNINYMLRKKFLKLINADLEVTSHFDVLKDESGVHNEGYLLKYELMYDDYGHLGVQILFADLAQKVILLKKRYKISDNDRYPFLAHRIVYDINAKLHLPDVSFLKSFVVFSKYVGPRRADIVISDYTLTYQKTVVHGGLNIFPKWADRTQRAFYYTSMQKVPTLYKVDIYKGTRTKIIQSEGMLVCSDVSSDGKKLLLTMAPNYQPDIYELDLRSKTLRRLTTYPGIDVNGNYVEDGNRIVFVSDRLGNPTIFAKRIGSKAVERVVYHGKNNSACTTYKDYVVYSSRETDNAFGSNTFNLYLTSTTSDYIRRLTANGINIFPRFAADGETILFIKMFKRQSALGVIRLQYNKSYIYPLHVGRIQSIDW
ncbi:MULTISPECIES: Tol-Pal system protein TolB [unclassified Nitratiruptor]|uniref:Tol-Pal system protein TolB n=1 Tax=unclassified Nitratiruptor TaxID=2624044 RepID=UPI00191600CE|nr:MULTISPECIES: Tol-Pal system protein TolB [unclassified Nitratiruptor]BCD60062.1 TolB protein [Nitratiruptor sp. YY08-10]BCD64449.1 TolB protein [Nitratiruptor sp. YY08-14]